MKEDKNIFLTGATGLVGRAITNMLSSRYTNINATYRTNTVPVNNINWIKFDISSDSLNNLSRVLEKTDVIIHNAACLSLGKSQEEINKIQDTNIRFTKNLLEHAVFHNIKKIIFTSTLSFIKKPLPDLITETSALAPLSYYSESKYIGEQLLQEYSIKYGINFTVLRLSSPVAPDIKIMPDTVVKKWIEQAINQESIKIYGNGNRTQDFIAVSDIAKAFLSSIEHSDVNGIFNIASGNTISMLELAQLITKKFNNKYEFCGVDENENDRWNISVEKAEKELFFKPGYTSREVIMELLNNLDQ